MARSSVHGTADLMHDSPVLRALARGGYATNGILHLVIGGIALAVAAGGSGEADQNGALASISATPGGLVVLWAVTIGLWALGLFQVVTAALVRGSGRDAWAARAKEAGKAAAYLVIGFTAFRFAMGSGGGGEATQSLTAQLLAVPAGVVLLVVIALATCAIGVYFVQKGIRRGFTDDIATPGGTLGQWVLRIGTAGYVAKGVAIAVVGILFGVAAFTADPSEASGLDGALKALAELPFGAVVLAAVAVGLIAYGIYCVFRARFARL
jgi:hypothetical protein